VSTFELRTSPTILFGRGVRAKLADLARPFGTRVLLVTGGKSFAASGELERTLASLRASGMSVVGYAVGGEPEVLGVDEGVSLAKSAGCDVVIGIGGGSALDTAKAIAAVAPNGGSSLDYLEGLGAGSRALSALPLPMLALPTTAGSGSEVTKNAVLRVRTQGVALKRSIRSDLMVPRVALVDPDLSSGAPLSVTAPAALDALTHLLEGYVSRGAQPTTDLLALEGVRRSFRALSSLASAHSEAYAHVGDELALASLWGGIVLANAGLGAVHGLVAPLGGRFPMPHGCGCGALLAATFRANVTALRQRDPSHTALVRYGHIAEILTGDSAKAEAAADSLDALRARLGVKQLAHYGVDEGSLAAVIAGARGGSMRSNPIVLSDAELESILRASLGTPRQSISAESPP